jgi:Hypoxia induced protein conserved region
MTTIPYYATIAAVLAVGAVLVLGLGTLLKGTSPSRSQSLMRWRIGLQFIAIVLIMLTVWLTRR